MSGPEPPVRVGIGLIGRGGRYLVRQRPPGSIMEGVWEFPGGKCEGDESSADATLRECREEIGLEVAIVALRRVLDHRCPHGRVELAFFDCVLTDPNAEPKPGTGFRWVAAEDLPSLTFPGANAPILEELVRNAERMTNGR